MISCPIKQCGRKFQNDETMLEHVRRRHPNQYASVKQELTKSLIEKQHIQQQQLNKLPKLAKIMSRQKKTSEGQRKSSSKSKRIQSANLSNLIQQSRQITTTNKASIATRRPSLTKKVSAPDLKADKLPPIEKQTKKTVDSNSHQRKEAPKKAQNSESLYQTLPDFKSKLDSFRERSKGKIKKSLQTSMVQKQPQFKQANSLRNTMTALTIQRSNQDLTAEKKKTLIRPTKKIDRKHSDKPTKGSQITQQTKVDFDQKIVVINSWPDSLFNCPCTNKIELLFLNNCNLSNIVLNQLQSLRQLSATHNKLKDMQFLRYNKNFNIRVIHLDYNQISEVYTPPRLKQLTVSFNDIASDAIQDLCSALKKSPDLQQIDLSFNNVRKSNNYKLKILASCQKLKKIDGLKITKIDIEMMQEFLVLESKQKGLIPLGSPSQDRPSTSASQFEPESESNLALSTKTIDELERQQRQYEKMIKDTQQQLDIIKQQNEIISSEIQQLVKQTKGLQTSWDSAYLFQKLQKQCQYLQLLNVIQCADEQEIIKMINQRKEWLGLPVD